MQTGAYGYSQWYGRCRKKTNRLQSMSKKVRESMRTVLHCTGLYCRIQALHQCYAVLRHAGDLQKPRPCCTVWGGRQKKGSSRATQTHHLYHHPHDHRAVQQASPSVTASSLYNSKKQLCTTERTGSRHQIISRRR